MLPTKLEDTRVLMEAIQLAEATFVPYKFSPEPPFTGTWYLQYDAETTIILGIIRNAGPCLNVLIGRNMTAGVPGCPAYRPAYDDNHHLPKLVTQIQQALKLF